MASKTKSAQKAPKAAAGKAPKAPKAAKGKATKAAKGKAAAAEKAPKAPKAAKGKAPKAAAEKAPKAAAEKAPKVSAEKAPRAAAEKAPKTAKGPSIKAHPAAKLTRAQLNKLHQRLLAERVKLMDGIRRHVGEATADATRLSEEVDIAQRATDQEYQLRLADKERKLLGQIQVALEKLETGEYGICEGTDEPIGFRRLEIRPWARYSVEHKEMLDRRDR